MIDRPHARNVDEASHVILPHGFRKTTSIMLQNLRFEIDFTTKTTSSENKRMYKVFC